MTFCTCVADTCRGKKPNNGCLVGLAIVLCAELEVGSWNVARAVRDHGERDTDDAEVTVA